MRKTKLIPAFISLIAVILIMFTVTLTAFATDITDHEHPEHYVEDVTEGYEPEIQPETESVTEPEPETQPETEPEPTEAEPTEVQTEEETTRVDELPTVSESEVAIPTTAKLPDIEVSDTSLLGGVIAWLCVALGIAVIAGVLVSQRTRQVGSNSSQSNRRR